MEKTYETYEELADAIIDLINTRPLSPRDEIADLLRQVAQEHGAEIARQIREQPPSRRYFAKTDEGWIFGDAAREWLEKKAAERKAT